MKASTTLFIGILVLLSLVACTNEGFTENQEQPSATFTPCTERADFCTQDYNPVIGDDNVEYSNSCMACSNQNVNAYTPVIEVVR